MIADIRRLLAARPFRPFRIVTSSGERYRVPTPEHAGFSPQGSRLIVWFDDESGAHLSALHIVALEEEPPRASQAA
jgi:hypothetical protein